MPEQKQTKAAILWRDAVAQAANGDVTANRTFNAALAADAEIQAELDALKADHGAPLDALQEQVWAIQAALPPACGWKIEPSMDGPVLAIIDTTVPCFTVSGATLRTVALGLAWICGEEALIALHAGKFAEFSHWELSAGPFWARVAQQRAFPPKEDAHGEARSKHHEHG